MVTYIVIPELRKQRQEDHEFKASQFYGLQRETRPPPSKKRI
jgi:hypothetical protein